MNCPTCGQIVDPDNRWQRTHTHQSTALALPSALPAAPNVANAYRKTPYRKMELVPDVVVPLLQAIITGMLVAICGSIILPWLVKGMPWYAGVVLGTITVGFSWGLFLGSSKETLWIIEEITGRDIDGDGQAGRPEQPAQKWETTSNVVNHSTGAIERLTIQGIEPTALQAFAVAVVSGQPFTEDTAKSFGITQGPFNRWRDELLSENKIGWRNPNNHKNGLDLSPSFRRHLSGIAHTPLPNVLDSRKTAPVPQQQQAAAGND